MAIRFSIYYFNEKIGGYLQKVINASPQGVVVSVAILAPSLTVPEDGEADVWFIEYDDRVEGFDLWIEKMQQRVNHPAIFLYLQEASTEVLLKALRLGVQECFVGQISEPDFHKALHRFNKVRKTLHDGEKTQIISLLGCKGGVGVTFLAVNLAQSFLQDRKEPVLLFDLDMQAADVSALLDIQPRYTILDVIENFDRLDPQYLKDIIHSRDSGLDVLPGPQRLEDSEIVQAPQVDKILQYLRSQNLYRWILLDLGDHLDEITLKGLEASDLVLLITVLTIPALRHTRKILQMLHRLEFGEQKLKPVANCFINGIDIAPSEATKFLGQDFLAVLRSDPKVVIQSINEGRPLVETQPSDRLSLKISRLARMLNGEEKADSRKAGIWQGIKRLLWLRGSA
ncbi:AAA family ATPase [Desulfobacca acetoxidans]